MSRLPETFEHASPRETLAPFLRSLLPYSLPVLRRIEFHTQSPHGVVISTLDPSRAAPAVSRVPASSVAPALPRVTSFPPPPWEASTVPAVAAPFAVLYMDRSRYPETESWVSSTADLPSTGTSPSDGETYGHLLAVLHHAATRHRTRGLADAVGGPADPDVMVVGSVSQRSLRILIGAQRWDARDPSVELGWPTTSASQSAVAGNRSAGGVMRGHTIPWVKYVFPPLVEASTPSAPGGTAGEGHGNDGGNGDDDAAAVVEPPEGLRWATRLAAGDYATIVASTQVPNSARTLALLPSRALRNSPGSDGDGTDGSSGASSGSSDGSSDASSPLQAWTFVKQDGSIGTLHVQREHRGRGVAKTLIRGLRAAIAGASAHDARGNPVPRAFVGVAERDAWCHSDTAEDNASARRVLASSGGSPNWLCYWGHLDLGKVAHEVERYTAANVTS